MLNGRTSASRIFTPKEKVSVLMRHTLILSLSVRLQQLHDNEMPQHLHEQHPKTNKINNSWNSLGGKASLESHRDFSCQEEAREINRWKV
eukprot:m.145131 g.145131  ORF g.145131 m.145131 type:complete len:90 (-) comp14937_c0_seq7:68-337(-)